MMRLTRLLCVPVLLVVGVACSSDSDTSLTVYQDAPTMHPVDIGPAGNTPGDEYVFFAPLRSTPGGAAIGEVYGTKKLAKPPAAESPDVEQRATLLFFTFQDRRDQIVVAGVPDYPPGQGEFSAGVAVVRAVIGGTGKYAGARGELTSTRNPDGTYKQVFDLKT